MAAYYNEIDPYAAQWLRNLITAGQIAAGDVDERSIKDVKADDLKGYDQCHFFAGIGGWSIALRLAGWPDDRSVWTGSCPCQPFSAAGAGKAADDERHLWPAWFPLIAQRRPAIVFGEQVEAAVGWGWVDAVFADLEGEGYACGATVLPACGVGGPHIRQRLWFVANADSRGKCGEFGEESRTPSENEDQVEGCVGQRIRPLDERTGADGKVADANGSRRPPTRQHDGGQPLVSSRPSEHGGIGSMANPDGGDAGTERQQRSGEQRQKPQDGTLGELADSDSARRRQGRSGEASCGRDAPRIEPTGLCPSSDQGGGGRPQQAETGKTEQRT